MDTGGKIATGIIVPFAVGGAAVAAYFLFFRKKKKSADTARELTEEDKRQQAAWKQYFKELDESGFSYKPYNTGGNRRRKTHRRRR